jgi:hypothetical protein
LAAVVMAKWEGEFDKEKAQRYVQEVKAA